MQIKVHPGAKIQRIIEKDSVLHIYVTEPPVDNKANDAVIKALAKFLKVSKSQVQIVSGKKSKIKNIKIL